MSKNVALFIDVANIYYAARGQDVDVDYIALLKHATKGRDLIRAYAYSGLDPENENQRKFLDFLSKNGYKVVHKDIRKFGDGRVKANLDIELVVDLFRLADRMDIAVIVSGDGDFASAIRALQDVGVRCEVISFRPNTSSDLIAVADEFTDIMKIIGIGRAKTSKTMAMPEMPAKEVNPEFGFREASRGVAAAALAALREGEKVARPSRRRTSRGAAAEPDAELVAVTEAVEAAATVMQTPDEQNGTDGEGRRRRRRRGGRGRGRGRRGEGQATAPEPGAEPAAGEPATGEVTWLEFDDISQLGDLTDLGDPGDERAYTFEEADAETLAALGLSPTSAATHGEPADGPEPGEQPAAPARRTASRGRGRGRAPAATEPQPVDASAREDVTATAPAGETADAAPARRSRRSTRSGSSRSQAADAPAEPPSEPDTGTTPARSRRTRTRTAAAASDAAPAAEGEGSSGDSPPRTTRTRRTRSTAGSATSAPADADTAPADPDADPGIWQRFRAGRRTTRRPG